MHRLTEGVCKESFGEGGTSRDAGGSNKISWSGIPVVGMFRDLSSGASSISLLFVIWDAAAGECATMDALVPS